MVVSFVVFIVVLPVVGCFKADFHFGYEKGDRIHPGAAW